MNATPRLRLSHWAVVSRLQLLSRGFKTKKPKRPGNGFKGPEGHGEKVWVFSHLRSEQVIYSFSSFLDGFHDLRQLPFNGKKTKPAKLRKDYWYPMARIEFGDGKGNIGRSVFQKLRELKHLHEVAWDDEILYKPESEWGDEDRKKMKEYKLKGWDVRLTRTTQERGPVLNRQKANAVADMASVLGGDGAGNLLSKRSKEGDVSLADVQVHWTYPEDLQFAEDWSKNVTHFALSKEQINAAVEAAVEAEPEPAESVEEAAPAGMAPAEMAAPPSETPTPKAPETRA